MKVKTSLSLLIAAVTCAYGSQERDIYIKLSLQTVRIRVDAPHNKWAMGSGAVIRVSESSADVLTCAHVVAKEQMVLVDTMDWKGDVTTLPGLVEKVDTKADLALIKVLGNTHLRSIPIALVEPERYDSLYSISSPIGMFGVPSRLIIGDKAAFSSRPAWSLGGIMVPGSSGSPLVNERGELACISQSCGKSPSDGSPITDIGFCIPLGTVKDFLRVGK